MTSWYGLLRHRTHEIEAYAIADALVHRNLPQFPAMTGEDPRKGSFMWRVFGLNFVMLSIIKIMMVSAGVASMTYFICFTVYGTIATGLLATHKADFDSKGADISPFLALFALETLAYYATILM